MCCFGFGMFFYCMLLMVHVIFDPIDGASAEKNRLEEKQRLARKERRKRKNEWKPRYVSRISYNVKLTTFVLSIIA